MAKYRLDKEEIKEVLGMMDYNILIRVVNANFKCDNIMYQDLIQFLTENSLDLLTQFLTETIINGMEPNEIEDYLRDINHMSAGESEDVEKAYFEVWNKRDNNANQ